MTLPPFTKEDQPDGEGAQLVPNPRGRPRKPLLPGPRFGKLVVQCEALPILAGEGTQSASVCLCDCGEQRVVRNNSLRRGHTKSCGCAAGKSNNFQGSHMALPKMLSREFVQYVTDIINTIEQKPEGFQVEFETNQRALTFQQAVYRIRGMVLRKNPADESPITKVGMSRKGNVVHVHPMSVIFATAKIKSKDGEELPLQRSPTAAAALEILGYMPAAKLSDREQYDELFVTVAEHILGMDFNEPECERITRTLLSLGWDYVRHAEKNPEYTLAFAKEKLGPKG